MAPGLEDLRVHLLTATLTKGVTQKWGERGGEPGTATYRKKNRFSQADSPGKLSKTFETDTPRWTVMLPNTWVLIHPMPLS